MGIYYQLTLFDFCSASVAALVCWILFVNIRSCYNDTPTSTTYDLKHFPKMLMIVIHNKCSKITLFETLQIFLLARDIRDSSHSHSPHTILRLYNVTFLGLILLDLVGPSPKKVSARRFYVIHYHGIKANLADLYIIILILSLVPEQEAANFHKLKQIVPKTSSRDPQHVLDNAWFDKHIPCPKKAITTSILCSLVKPASWHAWVTLLSRSKYKAELKAHLQEHVADYLATGWCQFLPSGDLMFWIAMTSHIQGPM